MRSTPIKKASDSEAARLTQMCKNKVLLERFGTEPNSAPEAFIDWYRPNYFFFAAGLAAGFAFFAFAGLFAAAAGFAGAFLAMS
jgi:hypothetical protein